MVNHAGDFFENVPAGTIIGTLSTTDPNPGETFTYAFATGSGDIDNSRFTLNGNQISINSIPDFETKPSYSICVRTTDHGGLLYEQNLTINVTQVPNVSLAAFPVAIGENGGVASMTATLSHATTFKVLINLSLSGTASSGVDYSIPSLFISIPAGSLTGSLDVTAINDSNIEGNETIVVDINTVANAVELGQQLVTITITDRVPDAVPPIVSSVRDRSSTWATSFVNHLDSEGVGAELGSATPLPWANINQIIIQFSEPVVGVDETNTVAPIFSFPANPVIAGAVFTNAAVNPSTDVTSPLANADLQVSADRAPFTFALTETKLFDFIFNVDANAAAGDYAVTIRDDSGFLAAINNGGDNLLLSQPDQFTFAPGSFSVAAVAVPEPSTLLLLACTGGAVVFNRFRTRTNKAISRAIA